MHSGLTIGHAEFEASDFPIKFTKLKFGFLTLKEALQQGVACGRAAADVPRTGEERVVMKGVRESKEGQIT